MKVPIETENDERDEARGPESEAPEAPAQDAAPQDGAGDAADSARADAESELGQELDEEAMVAEAIRRGEEAAEADLKADADKARRERDELAGRLDEAEQAVEKAKADAAEALERLARLQADWENYRRRTATERLAERELAAEGLVTKLLPVIDDMDRAIAHAMGSDDASESFRQFTEGVSAVRAKMLDVLAHEGVEQISPAGEPFEPLCHQAVGRVEDKDAYEDTVRDVYQPGYRMAGKVIRPAMVTVTYGGARRPAPEEAPAAEPEPTPDDGGADAADGAEQ